MRRAGGMTDEEDALGRATMLGAIRLEPGRDSAHILAACGPWVLRREAIIGVDRKHAVPREPARDIAVDRAIAILVAAHEAAAMDEDDDRHVALAGGTIEIEGVE